MGLLDENNIGKCFEVIDPRATFTTYVTEKEQLVMNIRSSHLKEDIDRFESYMHDVLREGLIRNFATALNYRKHQPIDSGQVAIADNRISLAIDWAF
jgi:hypothetical protein